MLLMQQLRPFALCKDLFLSYLVKNRGKISAIKPELVPKKPL